MIDAAAPAEQLVLDLDGYEGPIDLLLNLARQQKVDLTKISILALADQYLEFIDRRKELRLEIAADYLVTAAWLAFMKSRLLLPRPADDDEPAAEGFRPPGSRRRTCAPSGKWTRRSGRTTGPRSGRSPRRPGSPSARSATGAASGS